MPTARLRLSTAVLGSVSLVCGSLLLTAVPASAADLGTASTEAQFLALLDSANSDTATADTITLTGTGFALTADLPSITGPLTITGPGSAAFTLDAAGYVAIGIASGAGVVNISGVTITDAGTTAIASYAIDVTGSNLTLDDVALTDSAGGLSAMDSDLTVTDSSFTGSTNYGTYLRLGGTHTASFDGVAFSGNTSAGLFAELSDDATLTISHSTADDSDADQGLAIYAQDQATVELSDTSIDGNDNDGLYLELFNDAAATVTGVTTTDNGEEGIYLEADDSSTATLIDTTSTGNDGDGILAGIGDDGTFTLTKTVVSDSGGAGIYLYSDGTTVIDDLTVTGSDDSGVDVTAEGTGSVTISHASSSDNGDSGAVLTPYGTGSIEVSDSTFEGNEDPGIRISSDYEDSTGAVVTIRNSTIRDNGDPEYSYGGGISIGGPNGMTIEVIGSTISGNRGTEGGGIHLDAQDQDGPPTVHFSLVNSTVSGNSSAIVGGVYVDGDDFSDESEVNILNSTITANTVHEGGPAGAALLGYFPISVRNSIIADNIDLPGVYGDLDTFEDGPIDVDYSLIGVLSSVAADSVTAGTGNLVGVDPKLGPLANNGGPTLTHLPLEGSPAIDTGDPAFTGLTTDQRGLQRVVDVIDMGSVEVQASEGPSLAATGADAALPLAGGILLLGAGALLLLARRRLTAR